MLGSSSDINSLKNENNMKKQQLEKYIRLNKKELEDITERGMYQDEMPEKDKDSIELNTRFNRDYYDH